MGRVNRLFLDSTTIYTGYGDNGTTLLGAHRSTDNGMTWISMNSGLTGGQLLANEFVRIDSGIMLGTGQGVWLSTNEGQSWSPRNVGLPQVSFRNVRAMAVQGSDVYITIDTSPGGFLTTNRGIAWTTRSGSPGESPILVHNSAMYSTGFVEVRKSTNRGSTWTSISSGLPATLYGTQVIAVNNTLFVSSNEAGVYRSTNDGASWSAANSGLSGTALYVTSIAGNPSLLLAGTNFDGVFLSTNQGVSWIPANQGLTSTWIRWLAIRPPYAFAATDPSGGSGGVWRRLLTELVTSVDGDVESTPRIAALHQNYPNPFNPATTITFELPRQGYTVLRVHDVLARNVATLVDGVLPAGIHRHAFDASTLGSGVYFYHLEFQGSITTRKLMLLK
jgi:photosystem II stability/assembly factor-like uncharacterized protein